MPERVTVCGLFAALSLTFKVPVLVPVVVGSKNTPIEQLAPAATVLPQAFSAPKSAGLVAMLLIVSVAVPVFLTVTLCGSPVVPTYSLGKVMLTGDKLAAGAGVELPGEVVLRDHHVNFAVTVKIPGEHFCRDWRAGRVPRLVTV